ncbi:biopolymer transporter ExbD [Plastoroseomonas hellenica]|uniref:Biopolymer transporter ExbD n=1 Tax=Plastoroseomonas hellenica TaxID=2687306 RepID=A0ABS5EY82_9PROT|nr:biopolymer transporter ExbD [Plastoroseomonas hellenica]MBR0642997.1 biopolymer transporter ExbD [Plastoroseomonas hellenica]MBR0665267.1 biopolymer transporter ExbD [Plastoroseomonas hellenica]
MAMGSMPGGGDDEEASPVSEINVTPLVDVMLVLLVIFMVAAPMLTTGVAVNLPRTTAAPISPPKPPLELSIDAQGGIFIARDAVEEAALPERLAAVHAEDPERAVHLRADRALEYGTVLRVMALVTRAGITRVALVSTPGAPPPAAGSPAPAAPAAAAPSAPAAPTPAPSAAP